MGRPSVLFVAALIAGCVGGPSGSAIVGAPAPTFEVTTTEGASWSLTSMRGNVVLLDLMGVNCPPCREEMPHLSAFAARHANENLTMLSLDVGAVFPGLGAKDEAELRDFRDEHNASWPFARDPAGAIGRTFSPITLPTLVLIDAEGTVRAKFSGVTRAEALEEAYERARSGA